MTIDPQIQKLLEEENLCDLEWLTRPRKWDEVPLFTRIERIRFLSHNNAFKRGEILTCAAVEYLGVILDYAVSNGLNDTLVLISILDWDALHDAHEGDRSITPCFWISSNPRNELAKFHLVPGHTGESDIVRTWLKNNSLADTHVVLEEERASSDDYLHRVYIAKSGSNNIDLITAVRSKSE